MECEWEKLDNDLQYREAMEFLRAVANPSTRPSAQRL